MRPVDGIAVVVPARDEEALVPACLDSLAVAAGACPVPVGTIVVLDGCTDRSAETCGCREVETLAVDYANVGRARHAGVLRALQAQRNPDGLWIANTDADSSVPPAWLAEQVRLAGEGADMILGLAEVAFGATSEAAESYRSAYARQIRDDGSHTHIHGANLGIRARTYMESGGFPPRPDHEDRQLVQRVRAMRHPVVVAAGHLRVVTSGRTDGRCQEGVASVISRLAPAPPP